MDIIITIPKKTKWKEYEKEIALVENGGHIMNFKVCNLPRYTSIGERCYITYDGYVRGYMVICGFANDPFICSSTGKSYEGKFIQRSGEFYKLETPIKRKSFRGFQYYGLSKH